MPLVLQLTANEWTRVKMVVFASCCSIPIARDDVSSTKSSLPTTSPSSSRSSTLTGWLDLDARVKGYTAIGGQGHRSSTDASSSSKPTSLTWTTTWTDLVALQPTSWEGTAQQGPRCQTGTWSSSRTFRAHTQSRSCNTRRKRDTLIAHTEFSARKPIQLCSAVIAWRSNSAYSSYAQFRSDAAVSYKLTACWPFERREWSWWIHR